MIITVLWEDQRGGQIRGFGPHALLIACVADDLGLKHRELDPYIDSAPKKGNANVLRALQQDLKKFRGPVFAVLDRDKILDRWVLPARPATCLTAIRDKVFKDAPGSNDYDLIFLCENVETLVEACCSVMGTAMPSKKPDERDRVLNRLAWSDIVKRIEVRKAVPSFDRLVCRVSDQVRVFPGLLAASI